MPPTVNATFYFNGNATGPSVLDQMTRIVAGRE